MADPIGRLISSCDPETLDEAEMDRIAETFESVEICDRFCRELFAKNRWSLHKTIEWQKEKNPFVRRAAYILMQSWAAAENGLKNQIFYTFIPLIETGLNDEEPIVREAAKMAKEAVRGRNEKLRKQVDESYPRYSSHKMP